MFKVLFGHRGLLTDEISQQMSAQVVSVDIDYVNNLINMIMEQPLVGGALHQVLSSSVPTLDFFIHALDSKGYSTYIIHPIQLKLQKHLFRLDYASNGIAKHEMVFSFSGISMVDPAESTKNILR